MKKILFNIVRWFVIKLCWSDRLRDLLMWPITSRLLPVDFTAIIKRKNYSVRIDLQDQLNRILLFYGESINYLWEPQTTKLAQELIGDCSNSIVAGSHIGYINLELLAYLKDGGVIYTFEPASYLYRQSVDNIKLNKAEDRLKLFHDALSNESSQGKMYVEDLRSSLIPYSSAHTAHNNTESIFIITLDQFKQQQNINRLDFLFLDIEGLEYEALQGAKDILSKDKPVIIFEMSPKILSAVKRGPEELYKLLIDQDYHLFVIEDNYGLEKVKDWECRPLKIIPLAEFTVTTSYVNIVAVQNTEKLFEKIEHLNKNYAKK